MDFVFFTVASAPDNLSLMQDGETTIIVSWTTPTPLGDTTEYRVYYTTVGNTETSTDANSSTISLTSLMPGCRYNISIVGLSDHLPSEPVTSSIYLGKLIIRQFLRVFHTLFIFRSSTS